jgi:ElaB/YqjD/DUF883 family membrane-anchored ribosome-binding protein
MTALPLSAAEQARLDAIEAAPAAPESLRERLARAIWEAGHIDTRWCEIAEHWQNELRRLADAALDVLRGPSSDAEQAVERVLALAEKWDTDGDARYSHNQIARSTAARAVREAVTGAPETPR